MVLLKILVLGVITATCIYYLGIYIKGNMCHLQDRIDGKTVLITGANTGIGLETARELARRGGIVHMACRNPERCKEAQDIILTTSFIDRKNVIIHTLDLASITSILSFTKEFKASVTKLDILINNAGIICPYQETEDGFEMIMGVNHLGHFLLTNELLGIIKKAKSPRILVLSSKGHERGSIGATALNLKEEDFTQMAAYHNSKLANVLHAKYLAKMLKKDKVTVVSIHPGLVLTEIGRYIPGYEALRQYGDLLWRTLMRTPKQGAQTSICCAVDPNLGNYSGEYFNDCQPIPSKNPQSTNESLAELLWQQSTELINSKIINLKLDG